MKCAIELNSLHDVEKFTSNVNQVDDEVWLVGYDENDHPWSMSAKSLLSSLLLSAKAQKKQKCTAHNVDWNTLYCECDKDSMVDYLKAYAESRCTDAEFEVKRMAYAHARPFTKESLLYREIFEKYYPGQSEMVVDFWMPNKSWKGCDVNDPSARVLANYGTAESKQAAPKEHYLHAERGVFGVFSVKCAGADACRSGTDMDDAEKTRPRRSS